MRKYKQIVGGLVLVGWTILSLSPVAFAATPTKTAKKELSSDATNLQSVAQSYKTKQALRLGMIVQADDIDKNTVELVNYKNAKKTLGVTVAPTETAVSLSSGASGTLAYVVTSGRYQVVVSTQEGAISPGDLVSVSAIDGIGMKSDSSVSTVLGRAVGSFDGIHNVVSTVNLKNSDNAIQKAAIGLVTVDITVGPNPDKSIGESGVPNIVQKLATSIVGKPITVVQMYASVIVIILGIGVVSSLLYSGIQTGMISIGRNPLAKKSIIRSMTQVIVAGIMIFIGCLFAVYLILKI